MGDGGAGQRAAGGVGWGRWDGTLGRVEDRADLRASDADREEVAEDLRDHYRAGRLTTDELDDRVEAAYAARTTGELARVRADLPPLRAPVRLADPERSLRRRRVYQDAGGVVIAATACVAIWLAAGAHGQFWPGWVILVGAVRLMRDGWRLLGPGADLEGPPALALRRADRGRRRRRRGYR